MRTLGITSLLFDYTGTYTIDYDHIGLDSSALMFGGLVDRVGVWN